MDAVDHRLEQLRGRADDVRLGDDARGRLRVDEDGRAGVLGAEELQLLREEHPDAMVLVHPESPASVVAQAHLVGSTSQLLKAVVDGVAREYIVATDNGIFHRMRQLAPAATLIEAPTAGSSATCKSCAHCPWMAMNDVAGVIGALERGSGEIVVPEPTRALALRPIERMLAFVAAHPESLVAPRHGFVPHLGSA